ncbi:MAG: hypothetical protein RIF33_09300 [Cyclobacteriaceae bacterium]
MPRILKITLILLSLFISHLSTAQYTLSVGPILAKNPQLGGLDLKNVVFGKSDSLYSIGLEKKNEQFTTHSILHINEVRQTRETRLLLEGNNDLELPFQINGELWVVMYESIMKKTTLSRLLNDKKEVIYSYDNLKLRNGEKRFVLVDEPSSTVYLFYGNKQRKYLVHAFNTTTQHSKWVANINGPKGPYYGDASNVYTDESILLHSFINDQHIVMLEANQPNDRADLVLSRIDKRDGRVIDAIKLNPDISKYSMDILRYVSSTNKLNMAGRTYYSKKVKHRKPGQLFCLEIDMNDLSIRSLFLPDEMNEQKNDLARHNRLR